VAARTQSVPDTSVSPLSLRTFLRGWRHKRICPACQVLLAHERHALETLLNFLSEADFACRFEASAGLCVIHTWRAAEGQGPHPHFRRLIEVQRHTCMRLVAELEAFCRKHDYRFAHEPWGSESDAWLRAIELLAGKPGIFGSDIRQHRPEQGASRWWWRYLRLLWWLPGRRPLGPMRDQPDGRARHYDTAPAPAVRACGGRRAPAPVDEKE
jgi:hypothetical protein